jgi:hypothetical protein
MRPSGAYLLQVLMAFCFLSLALAVPTKVLADEIRYGGIYTAAPNGDVTGVYKFTPSMAGYQQLRNSISNLYLLLRILAPARAEVEVVDKKADWDDSKHTLTFSFKTLGLARNMGDHWEIEALPGVEFSNWNEATKIAYFNEDSAGPLGRIHGLSRLYLPAEAHDFRWDESRRVVSYVMPVPEKSSGRSTAGIITGLVFLILGAVLTAASFRRQPVPVLVVDEDSEQKLIRHDEE